MGKITAKTYIFDFDGTLVDSVPVFTEAALRALGDVPEERRSTFLNVVMPSGYQGVAKYAEETGLRASAAETLEAMYAYAEREYAERVPAKRGVAEALVALKEKGAALNVLTASPHRFVDACLRRLGIYDLFSFVWSTEDFGMSKSDKKIYSAVSKKLNKGFAEIVFVDDNLNVLQTVKSVGMQTIGVYDPSSEAYKREIQATCDLYVEDFFGLF